MMKVKNHLQTSFIFILIGLANMSISSQEIKMFSEGASYGYSECYGPPALKGSGCYGYSEKVKKYS